MEATPHRKKKHEPWGEPIILFGIALGIWFAGRSIIQGYPHIDLWLCYLLDFASEGLALYAIGKGAWMAFKGLGIGVSIVAIGFAILLFCWLVRDSQKGMIAGGFIAVVGAVLVVGKKR